MSRSSQPDLFGTQADLFGPPPKQSYEPSLEKVRSEVAKVLDQARIAKDMPSTAKQVAFWKTVFPQMTNWLPEGEPKRVYAASLDENNMLEAGLMGDVTRVRVASGCRKKPASV